MKISATFLSAIATALFMPQAADAYGHYTFQAFSGNECDGDAGAVVTFPKPSGNTKYISFVNRHSFRATLVGGNDDGLFIAYATPCTTSNCNKGLTKYEFEIGKSGCANVNTGGPVNGMALFTTYNGI